MGEETDVMSQCHSEELDLAPLDAIIGEYGGAPGSLIPVLQRAQAHYGYLPCTLLKHIAEKTGTPLNQVYGVVTFYSQFYLDRRGKYVVRQCDGTACHVRGSGKIIDSVKQEIGVEPGTSTPDYKITYEVVYCLGSCGQAPVAVINDRIVGRLVPREMVDVLKGLD
jgi:NADH:ubiquinone oxidoreductase subunit E